MTGFSGSYPKRLRVIFQEVLGVIYRATNDLNVFIGSKDLKLAYSDFPVRDCLCIRQNSLLCETGIERQKITTGMWDELPAIFMQESSPVPFDLFSAVFYLVSRYEEYLPFNSDQHNRFPAEKSLAFGSDFLRIPVVDLWCKKLAGLLGIEADCRNIQPAHYTFRLTIDIDQPWLFRNKGTLYGAGSLLREMIRFRMDQTIDRLSVLLRLKNDPGDTFNYLQSIEKQLQFPILYFVLMQNQGEFDKNRSTGTAKLGRLLRRLDQKGQVGIHPSYASNDNPEILEEEIALLEKYLKRKVSMNRQHFLRIRFPDTYKIVREHGILEDYTLGYTTQTGFRGGLARSWNQYDLEHEVETNLRLTPLIVMDRTLKDQMKLDPEQAASEYRYYTEIIRQVGGEFVCLWHNDAVSDQGEWKGWRKVFEDMVYLNRKI